jgi:hypothetical protein
MNKLAAVILFGFIIYGAVTFGQSLKQSIKAKHDTERLQ